MMLFTFKVITAAAVSVALLSTIPSMAAFKSMIIPSSSAKELVRYQSMASPPAVGSFGDSRDSSSTSSYSSVEVVTGVIIVDHGSRKAEANSGLLEVLYVYPSYALLLLALTCLMDNLF